MTPRGLFFDFSDYDNESRQLKQRSRILKCLAKSNIALTIPEISKQVKISTPTTIKLINELIKDDLIVDEGKKETDSGRRPVLYSLNKKIFYVVGVEILLKRIHITIIRIGLEVVYEDMDTNFLLSNTEECLKNAIAFIEKSIVKSGISKEKILGMGVGITGGVNSNKGESFNYYNFMDLPLSKHLEEVFEFPVLIENDTRVIGFAENVFGKAKKISNALVVNMSRGLGLTVILNKKVVSGGEGFAGEFGHMQFGQKERLCLCGKQSCLGTEVSGFALEEDLTDALKRGESSIHFKKNEIGTYRYDDILKVALEGDGLALKLLQEQGVRLGQALGNIINLLNPELIIIGGKIARVKDLFTDPVKMGIKTTSLMNPLKYCRIEVSNLGKDAGPIGAAAMILRKIGMI